MIDKNHVVVLFYFSFSEEKKTMSYYAACHNERKKERKSTNESGRFSLWREEAPILSAFIPTPNTEFLLPSQCLSLSLLFYSIPLLCLCHWTRILSACLSYLHQKCRQAAKGERRRGVWGWVGLCGVFLSCSQFKDNWIRDEITSIYVSESCDLIFNYSPSPPLPPQRLPFQ